MTITTTIAGALLVTTLLAAPAAAVIKVATYTGTVYYGTDVTGEFGAPNTSLVGDTMVTRYVYETSVGYRQTTGSGDKVSGGTEVGIADPLLSATVTINGVTKTIDSPKYSGVALVSSSYLAEEEAYDYGSGFYGFYENYAESYEEYDTPIPPSLDTSFIATGATNGNQMALLDSYDFGTGYTHYAYADGYAPTLVVGNVPEPATWALLLGGFATVGTAARRRAGGGGVGGKPRCNSSVILAKAGMTFTDS